MQRQSTPPPQGHPFRRTLAIVPPPPMRVREEDKDMKLFVLSFTAFFICFYTFLL